LFKLKNVQKRKKMFTIFNKTKKRPKSVKKDKNTKEPSKYQPKLREPESSTNFLTSEKTRTHINGLTIERKGKTEGGGSSGGRRRPHPPRRGR
jgi:hypothetical protein